MKQAVFGLKDLFPVFKPEEVDERQLRLVLLCAEIGVPFPAERSKKAYGNWWRSLHEIGHWAVKPNWYIEYYRYLFDDHHYQEGTLHIPTGTSALLRRPITIENMAIYRAGNDVIPELGYENDPTMSELETRVWALQVLDLFGWPHPSEDNNGAVMEGDAFFHKPASARVWNPHLKRNPKLLGNMSKWGVCVPQQVFRPQDMVDNRPFRLPHPRPEKFDELLANMHAIHAATGGVPCSDEWVKYYMERRWNDADLLARSKNDRTS